MVWNTQVLSHSRAEAVVWATRQDQMSWLSCHNGAFQRLGGDSGS
jgi:hypothetical protein